MSSTKWFRQRRSFSSGCSVWWREWFVVYCYPTCLWWTRCLSFYHFLRVNLVSFCKLHFILVYIKVWLSNHLVVLKAAVQSNFLFCSRFFNYCSTALLKIWNRERHLTTRKATAKTVDIWHCGVDRNGPCTSSVIGPTGGPWVALDCKTMGEWSEWSGDAFCQKLR